MLASSATGQVDILIDHLPGFLGKGWVNLVYVFLLQQSLRSLHQLPSVGDCLLTTSHQLVLLCRRSFTGKPLSLAFLHLTSSNGNFKLILSQLDVFWREVLHRVVVDCWTVQGEQVQSAS